MPVCVSVFSMCRGKTYTGLEPRVSLRWLLDDNLSFKASYSRMNQYVHLISNSFISLPTDAWMPVTKLKPLISDQVSAGFYYNLNKEYNFSVEGYYKTLDNLLEYRDWTYLYSFLCQLGVGNDSDQIHKFVTVMNNEATGGYRNETGYNGIKTNAGQESLQMRKTIP